jgi:hypothetical protein
LINDDQIEIITSPETKTTIPTEMEDTPPPSNELTTKNVAQTDMETSIPSKQIDNLDEPMDNSSPKPDSKIVEQLEDIDTITDDVVTKEIPSNEQMDTDQTTGRNSSLTKIDLILFYLESPSTMVIDDKLQENGNEMEAEVEPVVNPDVMAVDETEKSNTEVPPIIMVKDLLNAKYDSFFSIFRNKKQHQM